ncbi:MAG: insulinase family protein [Alphaproteobacteria bacterium]|nr:MAG: insulinase family protein [Alphaproteobacteria bacterium]
MTVRIDRLSNGLRIVTEAMPHLESAALGIWVEAGGRNERPEENGIAHFLEHMAFKGTHRRTAREIAEAIEDVGGYLNAYTSREMTAYYARVLRDDVPRALDVLADILLDPLFDPADIEVERGVILQEIGQVQDTPDDVIFDWLQEAAYPDQPMGRTILGPPERVSAFTRDDLAGFVRTHYRPERMVIAAAGAVDHDAIVRLADDLFGALRPGLAAPAQPARFVGGERRELRRLEQAHVAMAFEAPGYRDEAMYVAQVFAGALGGGMSSRLFQEVRERHGLCYAIFAQHATYSDTGMMTIYSGTSAEDLGRLCELTVSEIRRAGDDMTEAEVARARRQIKAGLLMGLESAANRAERLARLMHIWDRIPPIEETIARIDSVDVTAVRDFARELSGRGGAALALLGPVEGAPAVDELLEKLAA